VFAATWHGKVRVWNVATGVVTSGFERPGRLIEAGLSHDGKTIVMLSDESVIELWDIASGKKLRAITVEGGVAERVSMSPDEKRLAVGGDGVTIWDPATGTKVASVASVSEEQSARWTGPPMVVRSSSVATMATSRSSTRQRGGRA